MGIDAILGMELLFNNHSIIDCNKKVYLMGCVLSGKQLLFVGDKIESNLYIVSYVKATKYLQK